RGTPGRSPLRPVPAPCPIMIGHGQRGAVLLATAGPAGGGGPVAERSLHAARRRATVTARPERDALLAVARAGETAESAGRERAARLTDSSCPHAQLAAVRIADRPGGAAVGRVGA